MAQQRVGAFTPDGARRLAQLSRDLARRPQRRGAESPEVPMPFDRLIRWARTTTNYYYPTYPGSGGVYVVEFGEYQPDTLTPGDTPDKTFTAYNPQWTELAVDPTGATIAEGTIVRCELQDGQWWIRPEATAASWKACTLYSHAIVSGNSPSYAVDVTGSAYIYFDQIFGSESDCKIEVLNNSSASPGDPILKFTQPGWYFCTFNGGLQNMSSGVPSTQSVTTGAATAGTPHTHDVDCPIQHFLMPWLIIQTRASGGSWSTWTGCTYSEMVIDNFGTPESYSKVYTNWMLLGLAADDELRIRIDLYSTATSGTRQAGEGFSELTLFRISDDEPYSGSV